MADNIINTRRTPDETKESRSRLSEFSANKTKTSNKYVRQQTCSPSLSASQQYGKDIRTPKHRSRRIFNYCANGDSPSEAEALQDIIWDPASPPPVQKEASFSVVEISDIVKRFAPNKEKPADKDSVLQWIGDTVIPSTPDIQKHRVRRCSARRQNNNVEDLRKLAKQFDLNMTRQHKERNPERLQNTKSVNCKDLNTLNIRTAIHSESESDGALAAKKLSHEEELHALFDGPTQHLSGRLSPSSTNCSQENNTDKTATHGVRLTTLGNNLHEDAPVSKPDLVDDWEDDDDLLSDFVLAVNPNPLISSCTEEPTSQIGTADSKNYEPKSAASFCGVNSKAGCQITSHYTWISSKTTTNSSSFQSDELVQCSAIMHLPETSPNSANAISECLTAHTLCGQQQIVTNTVAPGEINVATSPVASRKELEVWNDGVDDDDLFYQACDDLERISDNKEQQKHKNSSKVLFSSSKIPLSVITTITSNLSRNKQNFSESASALHNLKNNRKQDYFTLLKQTKGEPGEKYNSTCKRHQSDPRAKSKVFITAQPTTKCSAAEIERKKQEAIERRRLRLQAIQNSAAKKVP